ERGDLDLDLACREVRVDVLERAPGHLAASAQDELVADLVAELRGLGRVLGVEDELADAGAVAQVDEDEAAVVAAAVGPAGHGQRLPDVVGPKLAAHEVAPLAHASRHTSMRCLDVSRTTRATLFVSVGSGWWAGVPQEEGRNFRDRERVAVGAAGSDNGVLGADADDRA